MTVHFPQLLSLSVVLVSFRLLSDGLYDPFVGPVASDARIGLLRLKLAILVLQFEDLGFQVAVLPLQFLH